MRDQVVTAVRRAIEAVLPWYDPQREAARDKHVDATVAAANVVARRLGSYGRVSLKR